MLARSREVISDVFSASIMCKPLTMKTIVSLGCCTSGGLVSWINLYYISLRVSVCPSVRLSVPLFLKNYLSVGLDILHGPLI